MSTVTDIGPFGRQSESLQPRCDSSISNENWYAVFTVPKHEKSVLGYLETRAIEALLPTYEVTRLWRNRQRVTLAMPLFPCYLFVRTSHLDYDRVRRSPGIIRIIGNHRGPSPISESAIELLRVSIAEKKIQPYHDLVVGKRVRVKSGPMRDVEGVLVRKNNALRFVLSIELINQHAAIEVEAENLEPIGDGPNDAKCCAAQAWSAQAY